MSVIIQNMKMPKYCEECRFYDTNYDYPTCLVTNHSRGYNFNGFIHKMPDCPLSEHGFGNLIEKMLAGELTFAESVNKLAEIINEEIQNAIKA